MDSVRSLRILVIAQAILVLLGGAIGLVLEATLPAPLKAWVDEQNARDLSVADLAALAAGGVLLAALIAAWVMLWRPRPKARAFYTAVCVAAILLAPALGPYVLSGFEYALSGLAGLTEGMILGLLYFSDLARFFGGPPRKGSAVEDEYLA